MGISFVLPYPAHHVVPYLLYSGQHHSPHYEEVEGNDILSRLLSWSHVGNCAPSMPDILLLVYDIQQASTYFACEHSVHVEQGILLFLHQVSIG